ncbi:MAG TPA: NUDIX domain-containing protein [Candidatus Binatia bacterium]|jgi:A/G-specific adenine glycosylase
MPAAAKAAAEAGAPAARIRAALLAWFDRERRDLPWRRSRSAYRIWISEVMLQQTRVEAVVQPYRRFLAKFPSLVSLARAPAADVVAAWSGLGYYRRARLLHAGARYVVREHSGRLPHSREALERIPGIGRYTASAILSMAWAKREAALDANVVRVVARIGGIADPRSATGRSAVEELGARLVDCDNPGSVNEALMDLGSALCTARIARCQGCPLASCCIARASGSPLAYAAPRQRRPSRVVRVACAVVRRGDRMLFVRRAASETLLAGMWELPTVEIADGEDADAAAALATLIGQRTGIRVAVEGPVATVRHDIVGRKISALVYTASVPSARRTARAGARFLDDAAIAKAAVPALPVKILREFAGPVQRRSPSTRGAA